MSKRTQISASPADPIPCFLLDIYASDSTSFFIPLTALSSRKIALLRRLATFDRGTIYTMTQGSFRNGDARAFLMMARATNFVQSTVKDLIGPKFLDWNYGSHAPSVARARQDAEHIERWFKRREAEAAKLVDQGAWEMFRKPTSDDVPDGLVVRHRVVVRFAEV